jgi:uncharacterized protein (TIGR04255 family)
MSETPQPLPTFRDPPVVETVLGVFFSPPPEFSVALRSLFWHRFLATEFPKVEERLPLDEVLEEFGTEPGPSRPVVQMRWQSSPPSPRLWAKSIDGKHTAQIQNDGLFVNWEREHGTEEPYEAYGTRRQAFEQHIRALERFFADEGVGTVEPTSCFVTYINHFDLDKGDNNAASLQRVLTVWKNESSDGWLPGPDTASVACTYTMPGHAGRLHVNAIPAVRRSDRKQIIRLDLTARGAVVERTIDAALNWLDLGHEWVVRGFASLTTPEMHARWGRKR